MDDLQKILDELVTLLEANAATVITNPDAWRRATRARLANHTEESLRAQHARLSGEGTARSKGSTSGEDYRVRELDRAISLATTCLTRADGQTGQRTFTDMQIMDILRDNHEPAITGRALTLAMDGDYELDLGRNLPVRHPDLQTSKPMSLADYRAHLAEHDQEQTA